MEINLNKSIKNSLNNSINNYESNSTDLINKRNKDKFLKMNVNESKKIKNNVFKNYSNVHLLYNKNLNKPTFINLQNVLNLLIKIFTNEEISNEDLKLEKFEQSICKIYLKKKYFMISDDLEFSISLINDIKNFCIKRKSEDHLKFIIKRAIIHINENYINKNKESKNIDHDKNSSFNKVLKKKIFREFYQKYFGQIAIEEKIPLENFFHFRCSEENPSNNVPTTITKKSICLWKKNPEFIKLLKKYIENDLKNDFIVFNKKKIKRVVSCWNKCIIINGTTLGTEIIINMINEKNYKLPWTIAEVSNAIKTTLNRLK